MVFFFRVAALDKRLQLLNAAVKIKKGKRVICRNGGCNRTLINTWISEGLWLRVKDDEQRKWGAWTEPAGPRWAAPSSTHICDQIVTQIAPLIVCRGPACSHHRALCVCLRRAEDAAPSVVGGLRRAAAALDNKVEVEGQRRHGPP